MKYAGNIMIVDDEGKIVYDRDLSADELIDELLTKHLEIVNVPMDTVPPPAAARTLESPTPGGCASCGSHRRHKKDCAHAPPKPGKKEVRAKPVVKATKTCKLCGEEGHTSRNCGDEEEDDEPTKALSHSQYNDVHRGKVDGLKSAEVAGEMNVPLKEVNIAFSSPSYDYYLDHRED